MDEATERNWLVDRWRLLSARSQRVFVVIISFAVVFPPFESGSSNFKGFNFIVNSDDRESIAFQFVALEGGLILTAFLLITSRLAPLVRLKMATLALLLSAALFPPYAIQGTESFEQFKFFLDNGDYSTDQIYWGMLALEWLIIIGAALAARTFMLERTKETST